jgi:hypothetical protein
LDGGEVTERDEILSILNDEDNYTYADWTPELNVDTTVDALLVYVRRIKAEAWDEGMEALYATTSSEWPPIPERNPYRD